jgi:hypothetical protein
MERFVLESGSGEIPDEGEAIDAIDRFALQHTLPNGKTVVDQFLASRPDLTAADRQMLRGCATRLSRPTSGTRTCCADTLGAETIGPLPFRRLAAARPQTVNAVFRKVLRQPNFTWAEHGEVLLRRRKPWYYEHEPRPDISVLGARLSELLRQ